MWLKNGVPTKEEASRPLIATQLGPPNPNKGWGNPAPATKEEAIKHRLVAFLMASSEAEQRTAQSSILRKT